MMLLALLPLFLAGFYPLARAWWDNRDTTLLHALNWVITAWVAWMFSLVFADADSGGTRLEPSRYLALCLTGCAAIAVLGARRPHVVAWNFVVLGLLAVMLLPLIEGLVARVASLDAVRTFFLGSTLAVGILNYLPTRLALAAVLLGLGCGTHMALLITPAAFPAGFPATWIAYLAVALVPWIALASWLRQPPAPHELDRLWLAFRNRYGLLWAQRVREQFNRSALNAGWPFYLAWAGLRRLVISGPDDVKPEELLNTLHALLKRFGPEGAAPPPPT
jgi:hypothetical protein